MGVGGSIPVYDATKDKCRPKLDAYLNCVELKKDGLKEGDECLKEAQLYKNCRKEEKKEIMEKSIADQAAEILKKQQQEAKKAFKEVEQEAEAVLTEARQKWQDRDKSGKK